MPKPPPETDSIARLRAIMVALRDPDDGCSWDKAQDSASIAPYAIEEAYELVDAIERGNTEDIKQELGDVLFQVIFHARIAEEAGLFNFDDVATAIADKMERRHPHIFAANNTHDTHDTRGGGGATVQNWEAIKTAERMTKSPDQLSLLDDVPPTLPGLTRAVKLQKRAAQVGFDWSHADPIFAKLNEEIAELQAAMRDTPTHARMTDELGDILFVIANLARHLGVNPETAIRATNAKFIARFRYMEQHAHLPDCSLAELEQLWQQAKTHDKN